jgi:hypothetical protein
MGSKSRKRTTRRDRRKARQTRFRREGKANPKKVGHGSSGPVQMHPGIADGSFDAWLSRKGIAPMINQAVKILNFPKDGDVAYALPKQMLDLLTAYAFEREQAAKGEP